MNPTYWLLIAIVAMVAVCFFVSLIAYQIGYDQGHLDAEPDRHTHRKGDPLEPLPPLPRSGILLPPGSTLDPFTPAATAWRFAGGWDEGPAGPAEYELLTRTAEQPAAEDETPSDFTRRMARKVTALIAGYEGDTNYWLHTHRADT